MHYLFPRLDKAQCSLLERLPAAIDAAHPLASAHRRDLPRAVSDLSLQLTAERSALSRPYWVSPRLVSAYLRYFMPWNVVRQARLLAALPLLPPTPLKREDGSLVPRLLLDAGSGPLTFVLALWLARPQWRTMPLEVLAMDLSPHVLELGRAIFEQVAGKDSPWKIRIKRGGIENLARTGHQSDAAPWLISAANMLNELKGEEKESRLEEILEQCSMLMELPDAQVLFIEPGTRLGGKTIMTLREAASAYGLKPLAPCPSVESCPLLESRTWCHFTFDTQGAPTWLTKLSEAAHLQKDALSISMLLLGVTPEESSPEPEVQASTSAAAPDSTAASSRKDVARIVSAPFAVPGLRGHGRYACTARGLALLEDAGSVPSGALCDILWPETACAVDKKSEALIIPMYNHEQSPRQPQTPTPKTTSTQGNRAYSEGLGAEKRQGSPLPQGKPRPAAGGLNKGTANVAKTEEPSRPAKKQEKTTKKKAIVSKKDKSYFGK